MSQSTKNHRPCQALSEVVRRLVQALDPREIWLFGSRAEDRNAPDSDFDLLVVTWPLRARGGSNSCPSS